MKARNEMGIGCFSYPGRERVSVNLEDESQDRLKVRCTACIVLRLVLMSRTTCKLHQSIPDESTESPNVESFITPQSSRHVAQDTSSSLPPIPVRFLGCDIENILIHCRTI